MGKQSVDVKTVCPAHRNNYEILKMLLDRGASIPIPHDVKCGCDECVETSNDDSLRYDPHASVAMEMGTMRLPNSIQTV